MAKKTVEDKLIDFIIAAEAFGVKYVFVDKGMLNDEIINKLKNSDGYSVVVGMGECARVKISW